MLRWPSPCRCFATPEILCQWEQGNLRHTLTVVSPTPPQTQIQREEMESICRWETLWGIDTFDDLGRRYGSAFEWLLILDAQLQEIPTTKQRLVAPSTVDTNSHASGISLPHPKNSTNNSTSILQQNYSTKWLASISPTTVRGSRPSHCRFLDLKSRIPRACIPL